MVYGIVRPFARCTFDFGNLMGNDVSKNVSVMFGLEIVIGYGW